MPSRTASPPPFDPRGKRVLVLNHNLRERGTYFRAWKVALWMAQHGARVTFVTTSGERWYRATRKREQGVDVWEMPNWSPIRHPDGGWGPINLMRRLMLAAASSWDVVYSFSHHPVDQYPARIARLRGARWICDWCDLYGWEGLFATGRATRGAAITYVDFLNDRLDRWDERLERRAATDCDLLSVISTDLRERAQKMGRAPRRIHDLMSGADLDAIRPLDKAACRAELGLDPGTTYLGYIANFHPDERLLLDALKIAFREVPDLELVAVGPGFYGGPRALESRGIASRVHEFGRVPFARIPVFLGAADILLVPMTDTPFNRSRWPNKIGDHLAAGRPQVAAMVGDVRAFMQIHDVGIGTEANAADFARAMVELARDPARRERLGAEARRVAETEFSWDAIVARLAQAIGAAPRRK